MRGGRPEALHSFSARAGAEPVPGTGRFHALGRARQHGVAARAGFRAVPAFRRSITQLAECGASAGRCAVHTLWLVASRRIADTVQRAGELLVEHRAEHGQSIRGVIARVDYVARYAGRSTRGLACTVRTLHFLRSQNLDGAPDPRTTRPARPAFRKADTRDSRHSCE